MSTERINELESIHTSCKTCVFAKWDGITQTGCKLDKLDDYRNAGIPVIEAQDEEREFYLIDGRFCVFFRNEQLMQGMPKDNWQEIVKLQTKVPYHAMVIVNKDTDFKYVKRALMALKNQKTSPNLVTIINKQYASFVEDPDNYIAPSKFLELLQNSEFHQYSLKNIYDDELDDLALVDLVFDSVKDKPIPFYTTFEADFDIPATFSEDFNNSILIKMMQLGYVKPVDEINGMIVNKTAHKKHGGNAFGISLLDKFLKYEENAEKFIYEIGDICPSLKK